MKKLVSFLLAFCILFVSFCSCSKDANIDSHSTQVSSTIEALTDLLDNTTTIENTTEESTESETVNTDEPDNLQLDSVQNNAISILNYLTVLSQEINESKNNRVYLENAYSNIYNNTHPNAIDKTTQARITSMLDTIEKYRMIDVKRERIKYIYDQNQAQALKKAFPDPMSILNNGNQHHRKYTHLGWNHSYSDDKANWKERKTILLSSASKIFKFGFFNGWFGYYNDKCDSFCALVYYIHILGDCIDYSDKNDGFSDDVIPFVAINPSLQDPDIFYELKHHLGILFSEQKNTTSYSSLMQEIENYEINARAIISGNTVDASELATIEDDLMQTLSNYVYDLLKNEDFYSGSQNLFTRIKNWLINI